MTRPEESTNIGPDHKVLDMKAFYSALVQALREARSLTQGSACTANVRDNDARDTASR